MDTKEITVIIPVRIDSPQRLKNIQTSIAFLLKYYECKIIVKEVDIEQKLFLNHNSKLKYIFEKNEDVSFFHRTKILNDMLELVDTKYTANYDCDMLIPQDNLQKCLKMLDDGYDFIFPYSKGTFLSMWSFTDEQLDKILNDADTTYLSYILNKFSIRTHHPGLDTFLNLGIGKITTCGGIQFFNTKSYKEGFGENEEFVDWGPEDQERLYRFFILGFKIGWIDSGSVAHMNHPKSVATDMNNIYNKQNHSLYQNIILNYKNKEELFNYMASLKYTKERKFK